MAGKVVAVAVQGDLFGLPPRDARDTPGQAGGHRGRVRMAEPPLDSGVPHELGETASGGTIPSPLCPYDRRCAWQGRAVLGPVTGDAECQNRDVRCLSCGRRGSQSVNLRVQDAGRAND